MAKATTFSPPPTTDEADRLYCQPTKIHAISIAQLAECTHWHIFDSSPSLVWARTSRHGPDGTPSMTRMTPPLTDFSPKPHCGSKAHTSSPQRTGEPVRQVCSLSDARGTHVMTSPADGGGLAVTLGGSGQEV
jgi:hypothetical protein